MMANLVQSPPKFKPEPLLVAMEADRGDGDGGGRTGIAKNFSNPPSPWLSFPRRRKQSNRSSVSATGPLTSMTSIASAVRHPDRCPDHDGDRLALLLPRTDRGVAAIGVPDPARRLDRRA